jgi:hypothetical protein
MQTIILLECMHFKAQTACYESERLDYTIFVDRALKIPCRFVPLPSQTQNSSITLLYIPTHGKP